MPVNTFQRPWLAAMGILALALPAATVSAKADVAEFYRGKTHQRHHRLPARRRL